MNQEQEKKKKKKTRTGSPNYSDEDIEKLLDIVAECEPIGNNDWCLVAARFNEYATDNEKATRDTESVKCKFDRLANTKKPTGDPSCPSPVRKAKTIARAILGKVNAISVGDESSDDGGEDGILDITANASSGSDIGRERVNRKRKFGGSVGDRKRQRKAGAGGLKCDTDDGGMAEYVGQMASGVSALVELMSQPQNSLTPSSELTSTIRSTVKNEMHQELSRTNASIEELKAMMMASLKRTRD